MRKRIRSAWSSFVKLKGIISQLKQKWVFTDPSAFPSFYMDVRHRVYAMETRNLSHSGLQSIFGISWRDKILHVSILKNADITSIQSMILFRQKWVDHVIWLPENRLPRQVSMEKFVMMYDQSKDKRNFKDQLKWTLRQCNIPPNQLETIVTDR